MVNNGPINADADICGLASYLLVFIDAFIEQMLKKIVKLSNLTIQTVLGGF